MKKGEKNTELWKHIEGTKYHEISSFGRIKTLAHTFLRKDGKPYTVKESIRKPYITKCGYVECGIKEDGRVIHISVHREVAKAFIPNPLQKPDVNHIDGNTQNNQIENLEWVTKTENMQHAINTGLWHPENRKGEKHPMNKLTKEDVNQIRELLSKGKITQHKIAIMFNVGDERISKIKHNKFWM